MKTVQKPLSSDKNHQTYPGENEEVPLIFGGTALVHFLALIGLSAIVSNAGWQLMQECT